jgi:radial spoke head protein 4A
VGLGRAEMYGVLLAVKALGEDPKRGVATARFFGKVLGTCADYYVFETTLQSPPEEPEQPLGEQPGHGLSMRSVRLQSDRHLTCHTAERGTAGSSASTATRSAADRQCNSACIERPASASAAEGEAPVEVNIGANAYVYFVCNQLGGPLTQLPSVTPPQIKTSRRIKKLLTGRLSSQVSSYPLFPGTEANYLRALVGGARQVQLHMCHCVLYAALLVGGTSQCCSPRSTGGWHQPVL